MTTSSLNPLTVIMAFHQGGGVQEDEGLSSPSVDHRHAHDLVTTVWRTAMMAPFHAQSHTVAVTLRQHWQGFGKQSRQDIGVAAVYFHTPVFIMPFIKSLEA